MNTNLATALRRLLDPQQRERGEVAIEAAILAAAMLMLLALIIFAGRYITAESAVNEAARAAARAASIAPDATAAAGAAQAQALQILNQQLHCTPAKAVVDASDYRKPPGQPANVRATVSCTVSLADLALPGLTGSKTLTATWTSPIDRYEQRAGSR